MVVIGDIVSNINNAMVRAFLTMGGHETLYVMAT